MALNNGRIYGTQKEEVHFPSNLFPLRETVLSHRIGIASYESSTTVSIAYLSGRAFIKIYMRRVTSTVCILTTIPFMVLTIKFKNTFGT